MYQATKDLPKWGVSNGDFLYVDYTHNGDHIEVFHKKGAVDKNGKSIEGTAKDVRNFDSSRNYGKRKEALGWKCDTTTKIWKFVGHKAIRIIKYWIGIK